MPPARSEEQLTPATLVASRGELWTVESTRPYDGCEAVALSSRSPTTHRRLTLLRPFDRVVPVARGRPRLVGGRAWARRVLSAIARAAPFGSVEAAVTAHIDVRPFQLEPALAVLRFGHTRVLIADEVGLGKTIQAALLLSELARMTLALRAIVLAPASLVEQWRRELDERFALTAIVVDGCRLADRVRSLPPDVNPWSLPGVYLASFDFAKQPEVLRPLEQAMWDLVIVDEAHNAAAGTHRRVAAHAVARRARRVVLLTATPPEGDRRQLAALLDLGRAGDPVIQFRRTRADVGLSCDRRTTALNVRLSAAERRLHRALDAYAALLWHQGARRAGSDTRLLATLLRKRALSTAASLGASIRRRMELLEGAPAPDERQLLLPLDEGAGDAASDDVLAQPGLDDPAREGAVLARLARLAARAANHESKIRALCRFVRRVRQPVIIFTEYRDTLLQLEAALHSSGVTALLLHGGLTTAERDESGRAFNDHGAVLLATDAAAEGLNLHHRCRIVVHFELPWTPARLDQRTGRVDRLGQRGRVHELLLVARHTAERLVLLPLLRRARAATSGTGHGDRLAQLTEIAVSTAVISGEEPWLTGREPGASLAPVRLTDEATVDAGRLLLKRQIRRVVASAIHDSGVVVSVPGGGPAARATLLFEAALADGDGRTVHSETIALRAVVPSADQSGLRRAQGLRQLAQQISDGRAPELERLVLEQAHRSFAEARAQFETSEQALARRQDSIRNQASAARTLAQAGLFDRRELAAHHRQRHAEELMVEEAAAGSAAPVRRLHSRVTLQGVRLDSRR
jgi:superfamily II DNA or RNA helicase